MKKQDLTKMALMGLASGCFIAAQAPEGIDAAENQMIEENFADYLSACPGGSCSANPTPQYQMPQRPRSGKGNTGYQTDNGGNSRGNTGGMNSCGNGTCANSGNNGKQKGSSNGKSSCSGPGGCGSLAYGKSNGNNNDKTSCSGPGGCGSMNKGKTKGNNNDKTSCSGPGGCGSMNKNNGSDQTAELRRSPGRAGTQDRLPRTNPRPSDRQFRESERDQNNPNAPDRFAMTNPPAPGQGEGRMFPMSEKMLLPSLNDETKSRYNSLPPEGKALALQKASDDQAYPDKNKAVMDAQKEIQQFRNKMGADGKIHNKNQTPEEMEKLQREQEMQRLRDQMKQRMNQNRPSS